MVLGNHEIFLTTKIFHSMVVQECSHGERISLCATDACKCYCTKHVQSSVLSKLFLFLLWSIFHVVCQVMVNLYVVCESLCCWMLMVIHVYVTCNSHYNLRSGEMVTTNTYSVLVVFG